MNSSILSAANHKELGIYYVWFAFFFSIVGTLLSLLIRLELSCSGLRIIALENQNFYNLAFTLHGAIMIFFVVMPGLYGGFGNYFLPIYLGASEVAFPRVNCVSLLLVPIAWVIVSTSLISEFGSGVGWTLYPPLSTSLMSLSPTSVDLIVFGLAISGISSFLSSVNFLTTIAVLGVTNGAKPWCLFTWAIVFTAIMLLATLPILTGGLLMLVLDLHLNTQFYDAAFNGDPVLYQHLFWFFGHPEVYIIILPAFGVISQTLSTSAGKLVFGGPSMILAMGCITVLGSLVWAHHMMTVGLETDTRAYFSAITMMIAIPTGTKIFNWLSTYMGNPFSTISLDIWYALSFIFLFTLGGTTGVVLGNTAVDVALHDTYYVIAHFHFVLSLGAIIGLICGFFYFQESMFGYTANVFTRNVSDSPYIKVWSVVFLFSILLTFLPMHLLGFNVMPRRIPDYADYVTYLNTMCSIGSISTVFILYSLIL
uniref:cytochrome c oxidase subunit 1 n=1 Tax=Eimeria chapmani TaxID=2827261 RepID=UPI001D101352|nr:cytochrome c oxidase subunit 1 [Eimeria chapmani]QZP40547.1 cytochrome c oxidase subunit 1 [Eimeria chapmani]